MTLCERCGQTDGHPWVDGDCVLPHRHHSPARHGHICQHCVDRHRQWLTEIVELYKTLDRVLYDTRPSDDGEYQKPRKRTGSPSPINLTAWALWRNEVNDHIIDGDGKRHAAYLGGNLPDVPAVLSSWAQVALDAQNLTATAPTTVSGAAAVLQAAAERIAHDPDIDTYDAELKWVYRALRAAHGLGTRGKRPVGRCPSLDGWGKQCGGPLWPDREGRMQVECGRCRRTFGELFLRHLGGMIA